MLSIKRLCMDLFIAIIGVPLSLILALVLSPLWRWMETAFGLELIGHSGPNGHVYLGIYLFYCVAALWLVNLLRRQS